MAESEGFEPPEDFSSTVFKTAAFGRSASSPEIDFLAHRPSDMAFKDDAG